MSDMRPIGVFDSGLGGLTVVKELKKVLPYEDIVYFGDTGRVPYGSRSRDTIRKYAVQDENFLISKGVKMIIAACGTVSSVAADTGLSLSVPFYEVVSHACRQAVELSENGRIAVIGTTATVNSGKHEEYIKLYRPESEVLAVACPLFVPLVENGLYLQDDIIVRETVKRYLEPVVKFGADTLILGCTHYPILRDAIAGYLGKEIQLVNMGTATAGLVAKSLRENGMLNENKNPGVHTFYVSDMPAGFAFQASVLLGEEVGENKVTQVDINKL